MIVNDQELIVIGGLIDEKMVEVENKIPLLGSIPVLGGIFKNTSQVMEKRNLIIFIKTTIVNDLKNNNVDVLTNSKYSQIEDLLDRNDSGFSIIPKTPKINIEDHIEFEN